MVGKSPFPVEWVDGFAYRLSDYHGGIDKYRPTPKSISWLLLSTFPLACCWCFSAIPWRHGAQGLQPPCVESGGGGFRRGQGDNARAGEGELVGLPFLVIIGKVPVNFPDEDPAVLMA